MPNEGINRLLHALEQVKHVKIVDEVIRRIVWAKEEGGIELKTIYGIPTHENNEKVYSAMHVDDGYFKSNHPSIGGEGPVFYYDSWESFESEHGDPFYMTHNLAVNFRLWEGGAGETPTLHLWMIHPRKCFTTGHVIHNIQENDALKIKKILKLHYEHLKAIWSWLDN